MVQVQLNKGASEADKALAWVCQAVSTDHWNYSMEGPLFVDRGERVQVVATDGRRLHSAMLHSSYAEQLGVHVADISDTLTWQPVELTEHKKTRLILGDMLDKQFPNFEKVIPEYTDSVELFPNGFIGTDKAILSFALSEIMVRLQDAGEQVPRFNARYIDDVFTGWRPDTLRFHYSGSTDKAYVFEERDDVFERMAVIMPMVRNK